jgi:hypothetical protein
VGDLVSRKRSSVPAPEPGTFRPAEPDDSGDTIKLFAVAARAVCAKPAALGEIGTNLRGVAARLSPPESLTAAECLRLWSVFERTVSALPEARWIMAGKALLGDLDALGQRLDVMPLSAWEKLPNAILDPRARPLVPEVISGEGAAVDTMLKKVRKELSTTEASPLARARQVQKTLTKLPVPARSQLLTEMIERAVITKTEGVMLTRLLIKGTDIGPEDEAMIDSLNRAGAHLIAR